MDNHGLAPNELKKQNVAAVTESSSFRTHGISEQAAKDYLKSPEGVLYRQRLIEAAPSGTSESKIVDRAIGQLTSGRDLPRMEVINEPLVKAVPLGTQPTAYTPFFGKESDFLNEVAAGRHINNRFGLPIASEAPVYDIYRIHPKAPTEVFVSTVAPTSELNGQVTRTGGATQYLVPNRTLFTDAVRVSSLGNDLALHQQLVVGKGLGAPIAAVGESAARAHGSSALAKGLGATGLAATAYDALSTHAKASDLQQHGSVLAAQSEWTHFAGRNVGGWSGAAAGARLGATTLGRTPYSAIGGGLAGGVVGVFAGERIATNEDAKRIYAQTDRDGVEWNFDGRHWLRQQPGDLTHDGIDNPRQQAFAARPDIAGELNYRASNAAVDLAARDLPRPMNPFQLPSGDGDRPSLQQADWQLDQASGQWQRDVVVRFGHNDIPVHERQTASPERSAALERQSAEVIAANLANGPVALAARYEHAYRSQGWEAHGPMPTQLQAALSSADRLFGSDGRAYERNAEGQWRHDDRVASGHLGRELDTTREVLQPMLTQHREAMTRVQSPASLSPHAQDRATLATSYASVGVAPNAESLDAAMLAVQRTRQSHGLGTTSVAPQRTAQGQADINSPLMHLAKDDAGVMRIVAITSPDDIQQAHQDLQQHQPAPAPGDEGVRDLAQPAVVDPLRIEPAGRRSLDASGNDAGPAATLALNDSDHPQHALYATLRSHLPEYTSHERLAQFTAECHLAGIKAHTLRSIHIEGQHAAFSTQAGWPRIDVDISHPAPPVDESLQKVDHHAVQQRAAVLAENEHHQQAPVMQH